MTDGMEQEKHNLPHSNLHTKIQVQLLIQNNIPNIHFSHELLLSYHKRSACCFKFLFLYTFVSTK